MKNLFDNVKQDRNLLIGIFYTIFFCILAGIVNYYTAELSKLGWISNQARYLLWILLYLPLLYFTIGAKWKIKDFGFKLNNRSIVLSVIIIILYILFQQNDVKSQLSFMDNLSEAFARTGEEVFFRGFVYLLIIKIFTRDKHTNLWAIILSSIIFTAVHTQPGREIAGFSLFTTVIVICAIPRWVADSILPCVIIHLLGNESLLAAVMGIIIFLIITMVGWISGENNIEIIGDKKNKVNI